MRFVSRLHVCAAATILMICSVTWLHHSSYFESSGVQAIWKGATHRIVVFGNDWSDTGSYRVPQPQLSAIPPRDVDRGEIWVETLCKKLACNSIDNFARSIPPAVHVGPVVDSDVYEHATNRKISDGLQTSTDLRTQVRQFIAYDRGRRHISERLRKIEERTTFAVFFGLWELLEFSTLDKDRAIQAIDSSVEEIFRSLDALADHAAITLEVVLPKAIDVTFLPRFQSMKNASPEGFAETQHHVVYLWTYWNTALVQRATQWKNGHVFMPDPNTVVVEQVRVEQLHSGQISDATGVGKQAPLFENVEEPCLASKQGNSASDLQAAAVEKCVDPAQHLFWDDIHLSGNAHQLIGSQAASLIRGGQTVNMERMQGSDNDEKPQGQEGEGFSLKLPPGY